jgi:3-hydroxybutyryl-CoA dehydratase
MSSVNTPHEQNKPPAAGAPSATTYYMEDLKVGMTATFSKTVAEGDLKAFADVSGDHNPIHLDDAYAATTMFKSRIAHGMLSAGYISAALAGKLPGPGAVYVNQTLKFKAPVRIGDTVTVRLELTGLTPEKRMATFQTRCFVGEKLVVDGEATLLVPTRTSA